MMQKHRRSVVIMAAAAVLASCSPHVHSSKLFGGQKDSTATLAAPADGTGKFAVDLPDAIAAVEDQRRLMIRKAGNYSTLRAAAPPLAIGATAASLYLNIFGSGDSIQNITQALLLGGGGSVAVANYFDNRPAQRIHYHTARALGCAIVASGPLLIRDSDYAALAAGVADSGLAAKIGIASSRLRDLEAIVAAMGNDTRKEILSSRANQGRELIEETRSLVAKLGSYKRDVDRAGRNLRSHAQDIVLQADLELERTEPDITNVQALLTDLQDLAKVPEAEDLSGVPSGETDGAVPADSGDLAPANAGAPKAAFVPAPEPVGEAELRALAVALTDMRAQAAPLNRFLVDAGAAEDAVANIRSCQPPESENRLRLSPNVETMQIAADQEYRFGIAGGTGIPVVRINPAKGVTVKREVGSGALEVVVTTTTVNAGEKYMLSITDSLGENGIDVALVAPAAESEEEED